MSAYSDLDTALGQYLVADRTLFDVLSNNKVVMEKLKLAMADHEARLLALEGVTAGPFAIAISSVTSITSTAATVNYVVSGTLPAGFDRRQVRWTTNAATGPWTLAGSATALSVGTFTATITMNPPTVAAGTLISVRADAYEAASAAGAITSDTYTFYSVGSATGSGTLERTIAQEYALVDTTNAYPPGNSPSWSVGGGHTGTDTWDMGFEFSTTPWGANNGPANDRLVAGGNLVYPGTNRLSMWPWIMPRKTQYTTAGNWRVQLHMMQMAIQTAHNGPWTSLSLPPLTVSERFYDISVLDGPTRGVGVGVDSDGQDGYAEYPNGTITNARAYNLEPRVEATGGISLKGIGTTDGKYEYEHFVAGNLPVAYNEVVAIASCCWARVIKDDPGSALPSVEIGGLIGVDLYGDGGRHAGNNGTTGEGRLVDITENWTPIVYMVAKHQTLARVMTVAETKAYAAANPPPFTTPS